MLLPAKCGRIYADVARISEENHVKRSLAAATTVLLLACNRDLPTTPTTTGCSNFAGVYEVSYDGTCTSQYPKQWTLVQDACEVHTQLVADAPTLTGTARGNTLHLTMRNGFINCQYQLEGDAAFDGRTLRGTVSGPTSGPCCGSGNATVQFTAVRR
jgi:hypothetical protein